MRTSIAHSSVRLSRRARANGNSAARRITTSAPAAVAPPFPRSVSSSSHGHLESSREVLHSWNIRHLLFLLYDIISVTEEYATKQLEASFLPAYFYAKYEYSTCERIDLGDICRAAISCQEIVLDTNGFVIYRACLPFACDVCSFEDGAPFRGIYTLSGTLGHRCPLMFFRNAIDVSDQFPDRKSKNSSLTRNRAFRHRPPTCG